ncbi:hypothetical protein KCP73_17925 [Salmonella enterica subsp. enterica]|nr:hypothetical protein KCP73_17925 [Salmonella enterica subsp. enterica]
MAVYPAGAGTHHLCGKWGHPRWRETQSLSANLITAPRAGGRYSSFSWSPLPVYIPAGAGNAPLVVIAIGNHAVYPPLAREHKIRYWQYSSRTRFHPRWRGEHLRVFEFQAACQCGLSPLAREEH